MREILFRGINAVTKEWIIGNLFQRGEQVFIMADNYVTEVIPETVGQFTGLTDRNGTRIFEEDIVRYLGSDGNNYYGDVYYKDGAWWINLKECCEVILMDLYEKVEVIGNVHDDPELIGGAEK